MLCCALVGCIILGIAQVIKSNHQGQTSQIGDATIIGAASKVPDASLPDGHAIEFASAAPNPATFVHPGILVSQPQLEYLKAQWASNTEPWAAALNSVNASSLSNPDYSPRPGSIADCTAYATTCTRLLTDSTAAYTLALLYYSSTAPDRAKYAQGAIRIMNAWSSTLKSSNGYQAQLTLAWSGEVLPRAAEIIRYTYTPGPGETAFNVAAFTTMMQNVYLPQLDPTLLAATSSNGNWDLAMANAKINIGVFTDNRATFDAGLAQWRSRVPAYIYLEGDGSTPVKPPGGLYDDPLKLRCFWLGKGSPTTSCTVPTNFQYVEGMTQETCRDISHVVVAFSSISYAAETARIQGVDLYGEQQERLTKGLEYAATFDNYYFNTGTWPTQPCGGKPFNGDGVSGISYTLGWESMYNHYANRMGIALPQTRQMIDRVRPTRAANNTVWETLTHAAAELPKECSERDTSLGSAVITVNAPINSSYRVWTLMKPGTPTQGTYALQVDYGCPVAIGSATLPADAYTWVDYQASNANDKVDITLSSGQHTLFLSTQSPGLAIAKVLLVSDPNCVPVGSGDNCSYVYDVTPPTTPAAVRADSVTYHSAALNWDAATDNAAIDHYILIRDGLVVGNVQGTSHVDQGLSSNTRYAYSVKAVDIYGNTSPESPQLLLTTMIAPVETHLLTPQASTTLAGLVDVSATANANDSAITHIDILIDGAVIGSTDTLPYLLPWDTTTFPNGYHTVQARAFDEFGNSGLSDLVTVHINNPDTAAPTKPTNLSVVTPRETSLTLQWDAAIDNESLSHYLVYRNGVEVATTDQTTFTDTGLSPDHGYDYQVYAVDAAHNISQPSETLSAMTTDVTPPTAPQQLVASALSATSVELGWDASSDNVGVAVYAIFRNDLLIAIVNSGTSYLDTTTLSGVTYVYHVTAEDYRGNVSETSLAAIVSTPDVIPPTAPASVRSPGKTETSISLEWDAAIDNQGVAGYVVYRDGQEITTTDQLAYTDTGLSAVTEYTYSVRAYDSTNNLSGPSETISITTTDTTPPSVPVSLVAALNGPMHVHLSWTASTDNIGVTGYEIARNGSVIALIGSETTYDDATVLSAHSYSYTVRARDAAGNTSPQSETVTVSTPDITAPIAPTAVVATLVSRESVRISWAASSDDVGVVGYEVFRDGVYSASAATTEYIDTGLLPDTTYTYRVYAKDAAGNTSAASSAATAITSDTTPPSAPTALDGIAQSATQLLLSWASASDNVGVAGYRISRDGTQIAQISEHSFVDSALTASSTYTYSVIAVDASGNIGAPATTSVTTLSSTAVAGAGFAASYFNNTTLSGPAVLSRLDPTINFNWGQGSPGPGVNSDKFSVRWTGRLTPPRSGTYTFYTDTDDGVKVWINNTLLINKWSSGSSSSATYSLTAGSQYDIKVEYYDATKAANAKLSWSGPSISKTVLPSNVVSSVSSGLSGVYYSTASLSGPVTLIRPDPNINFMWNSGSPDSRLPLDNYSVRWTGKIIAPSNATYTFYTETSDGVRLWVNNQLLIDNWGTHALTTSNASIVLTAGTQYDIRVDYQSLTNAAVIKLYWSYDTVAKSIIPTASLRDR